MAFRYKTAFISMIEGLHIAQLTINEWAYNSFGSWIQAFPDTIKARLGADGLRRTLLTLKTPDENYVDTLIPFLFDSDIQPPEYGVDFDTFTLPGGLSSGGSGAECLRLLPSFVDNMALVSETPFKIAAQRPYRATIRWASSAPNGTAIGLGFRINELASDFDNNAETTIGIASGLTVAMQNAFQYDSVLFNTTTNTSTFAVIKLYKGNSDTYTYYIDEIRIEPAHEGTSFPVDPVENERFFRTDRGVEYYWDGTRWLSVDRHEVLVPPYVGAVNAIAATTTTHVGAVPYSENGIWFEGVRWGLRVNSASTASNRWTGEVFVVADGAASGAAVSTGCSFDSNTEALGDTVWEAIDKSNAQALTGKAIFYNQMTEFGSVGTVSIGSILVRYRLIG